MCTWNGAHSASETDHGRRRTRQEAVQDQAGVSHACGSATAARTTRTSPESVSALKPTEDGWEADVEVLELERIPETTSVMATYRVTLDKEGDLVAYERKRRYTRGQIDRRG